MKSGIGTSVRYIHDGNAVICIVTPNLRYNQLYQYIRDMEQAVDDLHIAYKEQLPYPLPEEFKGVARLKTGDKDDYKFAREIARKKAVRKMYKFYYNAMNNMSLHFGEAWGRYRDITAEVKERINTINDEIIEITSDKGQG